MSKSKTPAIGGSERPHAAIGLGDAKVAKAPPGRARFAPIGTQDEQTEGDRRTGRPRRDG